MREELLDKWTALGWIYDVGQEAKYAKMSCCMREEWMPAYSNKASKDFYDHWVNDNWNKKGI